MGQTVSNQPLVSVSSQLEYRISRQMLPLIDVGQDQTHLSIDGSKVVSAPIRPSDDDDDTASGSVWRLTLRRSLR